MAANVPHVRGVSMGAWLDKQFMWLGCCGKDRLVKIRGRVTRNRSYTPGGTPYGRVEGVGVPPTTVMMSAPRDRAAELLS